MEKKAKSKHTRVFRLHSCLLGRRELKRVRVLIIVKYKGLLCSENVWHEVTRRETRAIEFYALNSVEEDTPVDFEVSLLRASSKIY